MKIIKRDGRAVEYNSEKIFIAIEKANKEVRQKERATSKEIKEITNYIEEFGKKRMLVEDIQDIIEKKLMEIGRYELAKKYIVYRYTRALVRKQNTTDESILGIIRDGNNYLVEENSNKSTVTAATQRDYIAGEVSRDLTKRLLLPEKIVKAEEEGFLNFHNSEYFIQAIFDCCIINLADMLDNGTVINDTMIESPKSFQSACNVTTQIITAVGSNQYGGITVDLMHLGKYLRKSKNKLKKEIEDKYKEKIQKDIINDIIKERLNEELKCGVQTILYQVNTLMTANGHAPAVMFFSHLEENDEYIKENEMINNEILTQIKKGIKNKNGEYITPVYPKLVHESEEEKLFYQIEGKRFLLPNKDKEGIYKFDGKFNQGMVSINLEQIGLSVEGNEEQFWKTLDEKLELCKEALMCRHYALVGTKSDISPIHWQYGAIARLKEGEKIDKLLYGEKSILCLGYIGLDEASQLITKEEEPSEKTNNFAKKVIKYLKQTTEKWKKETNVKFVLGD